MRINTALGCQQNVWKKEKLKNLDLKIFNIWHTRETKKGFPFHFFSSIFTLTKQKKEEDKEKEKLRATGRRGSVRGAEGMGFGNWRWVHEILMPPNWEVTNAKSEAILAFFKLGSRSLWEELHTTSPPATAAAISLCGSLCFLSSPLSTFPKCFHLGIYFLKIKNIYKNKCFHINLPPLFIKLISEAWLWK